MLAPIESFVHQHGARVKETYLGGPKKVREIKNAHIKCQDKCKTDTLDQQRTHLDCDAKL